jgi:hypothetical protein
MLRGTYTFISLVLFDFTFILNGPLRNMKSRLSCIFCKKYLEAEICTMVHIVLANKTSKFSFSSSSSSSYEKSRCFYRTHLSTADAAFPTQRTHCRPLAPPSHMGTQHGASSTRTRHLGVDTEYLTNSNYFPQTSLKAEVHLEIHESLFCTPQKTHCITITKTNMNKVYRNNWWLLHESQNTQILLGGSNVKISFLPYVVQTITVQVLMLQ